MMTPGALAEVCYNIASWSYEDHHDPSPWMMMDADYPMNRLDPVQKLHNIPALMWYHHNEVVNQGKCLQGLFQGGGGGGRGSLNLAHAIISFELLKYSSLASCIFVKS
jgi:hypothetical protein